MHDVQLTDRQRAFAEHYVNTGGKVGIASQRAGYSDRTMGSKLLRDPKVIKLIQEMMVDAIGVHAASALGTVVKLAKSARSDYVRLEAAKDILDRAGFKPPDKQLVKLSGDLSVSFDIAPQPIDVTERGGLENSE
ncbi:Terminase small subunit [uncultured Caudovirales phage]|uniref:Terminase small subunit n=1 Tax=uncultured Caudovirales phage TaxID=2100421 RepID=A0A6J5R7N1_9CAUD|nr:Terminase small subunit [uncultured Caudovirales phage]